MEKSQEYLNIIAEHERKHAKRDINIADLKAEISELRNSKNLAMTMREGYIDDINRLSKDNAELKVELDKLKNRKEYWQSAFNELVPLHGELAGKLTCRNTQIADLKHRLEKAEQSAIDRGKALKLEEERCSAWHNSWIEERDAHAEHHNGEVE